jgi:hypothetical protein
VLELTSREGINSNKAKVRVSIVLC